MGFFKVFLGSSKGDLRQFQGFKDVSRTFIKLSSVFQECLREV